MHSSIILVEVLWLIVGATCTVCHECFLVVGWKEACIILMQTIIYSIVLG
jgi:hypothetical protein